MKHIDYYYTVKDLLRRLSKFTTVELEYLKTKYPNEEAEIQKCITDKNAVTVKFEELRFPDLLVTLDDFNWSDNTFQNEFLKVRFKI